MGKNIMKPDKILKELKKLLNKYIRKTYRDANKWGEKMFESRSLIEAKKRVLLRNVLNKIKELEK